MKTNFEIWLEDNIYYSNVLSLLNEAVICYKVSANKAALLLSYMAFTDIIRRRLLEAKKPDKIIEGEWIQKRKLLLDDDAAEKEVFDILNRADDKYFKLNDSIRVQIRYWKDRRNDCAHLKSNPIDSVHVESFWLFLMNNINKFTVIDSGKDLLNKINRHFDETYTPMGTDIAPLISEIPYSVEIADFPEFLQYLYSNMQTIIEDSWFAFDERAKTFNCMLSKLEGEYNEITKKFIYNNNELQKELFEYCPEFLTYFKDSSMVRELWKTTLKKVNTFKIASVLLRNSLVEVDQIKEFINDCAYMNADAIPKDEDFKFLIPYGFQDKIDDFLETALTKITSLEWWVKENQKFIKFYIKYSFNMKNAKIIDLFINGYSNTISDEKIDILYRLFSEVINDNNINLEYAKERALANKFDIDDILFIY